MVFDISIALQDPAFYAFVIVTIISAIQFSIIRKITSICRTYAKLTVARARITADGEITLDDPDIIPFVNDSICLMEDLEEILHWMTGYIINHPSTGWIKGYAPRIKDITDATIAELATTTDQPVQPVNPEGA